MASIKIPSPLRKYTQDQSEVKVEGKNIQEALESLTSNYPELAPHIFDDNKKVRGFVRLYLGEDDVQELEGLSTEISKESRINIIPAIAGGTQNPQS